MTSDSRGVPHLPPFGGDLFHALLRSATWHLIDVCPNEGSVSTHGEVAGSEEVENAFLMSRDSGRHSYASGVPSIFSTYCWLIQIRRNETLSRRARLRARKKQAMQF